MTETGPSRRGGARKACGVRQPVVASASARTAGRRDAMTFFASDRGLVRKPQPHYMCMVASATGIWSRAFSGSPLPAGTEPSRIAAR